MLCFLQDRKIIHNNAELKSVFGCETMSFTQIPQLINDHLLVPEPVEIQYSLKCVITNPIKMILTHSSLLLIIIRLHGDALETEEVWDIPFELDETVNVNLQPQQKKEIESFDETIAANARSVAEHKLNRDILLNFAANPAEYLNVLVSAQTRDWVVANAQESGIDDEERFVPFYYQPLVHDAVSQYLAKNAPRQ
jgi:SWI/SNF-related matrix-associated actin-dependent regulator of chromatin subfamily D